MIFKFGSIETRGTVKANLKKLIITHIDPDHDDAFFDGLEKECQKILANSLLQKKEWRCFY